MINPNNLYKGMKVRVELEKISDRLSNRLIDCLKRNSVGKWLGEYKMVDGNKFALVIELENGIRSWFFEEELTEIPEGLNELNPK